REHRLDGIALVRHGGRPAPVARADFADLVLREEHDVGPDLCARRCRLVEGGADRPHRMAVCMPRDCGLVEMELPGECGNDVERPVAERRERTRGSAEL